MAVALCAAFAAPALGAGTELPEALSDRELVGMAIFIVVGVTLMVLSWLTRLWIRNAATTDPRKLARDDPWVRAYLARAKAAGIVRRREPGSSATDEVDARGAHEANGDT
jgi:hypothetical protein